MKFQSERVKTIFERGEFWHRSGHVFVPMVSCINRVDDLAQQPGDYFDVVPAVHLWYKYRINPRPFIASQEIALISNSNHRYTL